MKKLTKAALTRLTKKALNGDSDAQFVLANVYCYAAAADGVIRDRIKAFEWAEKAATQGHTQALFFVGDALLWGKGVAQDPVKAVKMLDKAALQGCPNAYRTIKSIAQTL
ncbi:MAG TPA: hypothetical protein VL020_04910 [Pseudomonadales bacterium]|nr:hypothetical protein [Pseudomonadales bacterium]